MTATPPESQAPLVAAFESRPATEHDGTATEPRKLGPLFITVYALAMLGIWMAINLPATVTVALRISEIDPANKTTT